MLVLSGYKCIIGRSHAGSHENRWTSLNRDFADGRHGPPAGYILLWCFDLKCQLTEHAKHRPREHGNLHSTLWHASVHNLHFCATWRDVKQPQHFGLHRRKRRIVGWRHRQEYVLRNTDQTGNLQAA